MTLLDNAPTFNAMFTAVLESTFVTATVGTASGNSYVVVTRNGITTLIATKGDHAGRPISGDRVAVHSGGIYLYDGGRLVCRTTGIVSVDIHEN